MKPECSATVVCLSSDLKPCVTAAVALLTSCKEQANFGFSFEGLSDALRNSGSQAPHSWSKLELVLAGEREKRGCENLIGVLDEPIENNWFSRTAYGKNVAWVTTGDWEFYSDVPVTTFVAYEIVSNLVLMLVAKRPGDEEWLMREVIHTQETRECISDVCAYKPDISRKIRSGEICEDCRRVLGIRLSETRLEALLKLLGVIRGAAAARKAAPNGSDFPVLKYLHYRTAGLLKGRMLGSLHDELWLLERAENELEERLQSNVEAGLSAKARLARELERLRKRLTAVRAQVELPREGGLRREEQKEIYHAFGTASFEEEIVEVEGSLVEDSGPYEAIERRYPFPIAYCFRAMRAELRPVDRWLRMYDLYKLVIRYITFVLLADRADRKLNWSADLGAMVENLKYCADGKWGKTCMGMIRLCREKLRRESVVFGFLDSLGTAEIADVENFSRVMVKDRDFKQGHGYKEDAVQYQGVFEKHLPGMKRVLHLVAPLAGCVLIRPVEVVHNCGEECVFVSKLLVGADTIFLPYTMYSTRPPETVCQLLSPDGERRLTLHPWLHLERCETCQREMVFLFHEVSGYGPKAVTKLREYPSNHEKERPDLTGKVLSCLRAG